MAHATRIHAKYFISAPPCQAYAYRQGPGVPKAMHWRDSALPSPGGKVPSEARRMRNGDILQDGRQDRLRRNMLPF